MKCILPWVSLNVRTDGTIHNCPFTHLRITDENGDLVSLGSLSVEKLYNVQRFQEIRLGMLNNEILPECSRCNEEERLGAYSKRQASNSDFKKYLDRFEQTESDGSTRHLPIAMNLALGNTCNLQCRMCQPKFSSQIARAVTNPSQDERWKKYVPKSDLRQARSVDAYLEDFDYMKEGLSAVKELLPNLRQLWLSGGEPTLSPYFEPLMDHIVENGYNKNLNFGFTTNLTNLRWVKYFAAEWRLPELHFSFDGVGKVQEYIRYPIQWKIFESNLLEALKLKNVYIRPCMTISALNVHHFPEMIIYLSEVYASANVPLEFRINLLVGPAHLRIEALPLKWRQQIAARLAQADLMKDNIPDTVNGRFLLKKTIQGILGRLNAPVQNENDFLIYNQSLDQNRRQQLGDVLGHDFLECVNTREFAPEILAN